MGDAAGAGASREPYTGGITDARGGLSDSSAVR
jgi:hypothetical protein